MEQDPGSSLFGLNIDLQSTAVLRTASQWGKVLSVLGFLLGILIAILGFVLYNKITFTYRAYGVDSPVNRSLQTVAMRYLIVAMLFAAVFITGAVFMLNFSNRMIVALNTSDQFSLNNGLTAVKNAIIFWTIIFILFIGLMLLAFLGVASL